MNDRLNELEAKLTLAEDLLDALNLQVFRQQQEIDRLQRDLLGLREQIRVTQPELLAKDEVPPHY